MIFLKEVVLCAVMLGLVFFQYPLELEAREHFDRNVFLFLTYIQI